MGSGGSARLLGCAALLASACGGRVDESAEDPGEPSPLEDPTSSESATAGSAATASSAAAAAGSPPATDNPDADTELGECVLGPLEYSSPGKPCAWVTGGRCYAKRAMACNCACPRTHDSLCVSGFEGGLDDRVWVACN